MKTVISPGDRVQVDLYRKNYFQRTVRGLFVAWTNSGKCRVLEDGQPKAKVHNPDHVKRIR